MNIEELERLNSLKERGIITEEEFNIQKQRLLNEGQPVMMPNYVYQNAYVAPQQNSNVKTIILILVIIFALPILGVLSVGGIAGYSKAMSKYRTNKVIDQATMIITNIRTMFAQQQSYLSLNNARAVNLALIPEEMIVDPQSNVGDNGKRALRNIFSGNVLISSSPIDDDDYDEEGAFKVTFYGISRDACIQIATSDWGAGRNSGLVGLHIWDAKSSDITRPDLEIDEVYRNGYDGYDASHFAIPGIRIYKVPFTITQAQNACSCGNKNTCAVTWKYF